MSVLPRADSARMVPQALAVPLPASPDTVAPLTRTSAPLSKLTTEKRSPA